jgi:hypothetical protein
MRHLGVNRQHEAAIRHFLERRGTILNVGDTKIGIGRGTRWIVLAANDPRLGRLLDFGCRRLVRQVERHEGLEMRIVLIGWHGCLNVRLICQGFGRCCDGRLGIRHHETAAKALGGVLENGRRLGAVAAVMVKVIRQANRQAGAGGSTFGRGHGNVVMSV